MPVPPYRPVAARTWRFQSIFLPACPGYFGGPRPLEWTTYVLARDSITWMSLVPMEVESQMPHLAVASGTVVICGLGLGLMAYAVAARKAVSRVIVVERDPEVADMFREFSAFDTWPQRSKVELVLADAREFRFGGADFLYVDIWPFYRMDTMIQDMKAIHRNVPAPRCGYWGQELDMVDFARARGVALDDFAAQDVEAFATTHGFPLIGLEEPDYPLLCRRAAVNLAIGAKRRPITA
jgi:Spermidine synthase